MKTMWKAGTIKIAFSVTAAAVLTFGGSHRAAAHSASAVAVAEPQPVRLFAQAGLGILEIAHIEVGTFVGPHVSLEGTAAWAGVFGSRYGAGAFYTFGQAQGRRPPRHGWLVGARLMLNADATFDSHGEEMSSYGVIPVGYSYLSDSGFFFRTTVGAAIVRERRTLDAAPGTVATFDHHLIIGGPMFTAAFGFAF